MEKIAQTLLIKGSKKKLIFREQLKLPKNSKFLDCGCGFGDSTIQAGNDDFVSCGFDISKYKIKFIFSLKKRKNTHFLLASAEKIPFKMSSFDIVYCNHVLEHIINDNLVLDEIYRILNNYGILILTVPNIDNLSTSLKLKMKKKFPFTDKTHLREYDKKSLEIILRKHYFKILKTKGIDFVPPIASKLFHFIVIYLNLQILTNFLAKVFPARSLENQFIVVKMGKN